MPEHTQPSQPWKTHWPASFGEQQTDVEKRPETCLAHAGGGRSASTMGESAADGNQSMRLDKPKAFVQALEEKSK